MEKKDKQDLLNVGTVSLILTARADICSAPASVDFTENNSVGDTVTTITVQPGVTIALKTDPANPDNSFALEDNRLIATEVLDYEVL